MYVKGLLFLSLLLSLSAVHAQNPEICSGARIAFMGDSITDMGFWKTGYCSLVMKGLEVNGIKAVGISAGISNQSSRQMLPRLESSVISRNATVMTLNSGVNDVGQGVPLKEYEKNMTEMVERAQKAGIKVYILTATLIQEDLSNRQNAKAVDYNAFLRRLAKEKGCVLVDLNTEMRELLRKLREKYPQMKKNIVTVDGLHMTPLGNLMMAECVLRGFGFSASQIEKARAEWMKTVGAEPVSLTLAEYEELSKVAYRNGQTLQDYLGNLLLEKEARK